jgi:Uma2 family endonuclease
LFYVIKEGVSAMPLPKERLYTIEDIYALPEGTRAELIDGQMYMMAPPTRHHQRIVSHLHAAIYNYINSKKGSCEVYPAPFAVFLSQNNQDYIEPDISVICDPDKLTDKGCKGAPDWIIEIVSTGSRQMDYYTKLFKYQTAGVREYWIVDFQKNRILVYNFESETTDEYSFSDSINVGIYEDLSIDFSQMEL